MYQQRSYRMRQFIVAKGYRIHQQLIGSCFKALAATLSTKCKYPTSQAVKELAFRQIELTVQLALTTTYVRCS